jgi:tetraacyldisaccharide 4'-kinase
LAQENLPRVKSFWIKKVLKLLPMPFYKILLWPFAVLYDGVTRVRNHLYDIGHKRSFKFETVVISVGNLNVGGSGKTPMIEYLVRLLGDKYSLAILSRGYGRKTKGFRLANDQDDAKTLGDESYQYYRKYGKSVAVCVGEERALAIPTILNERHETQVILLDDAFQHRSVRPQFSILLTEYYNLFSQDYLLPMGRLRESRSGAKRADVVVVTKCFFPVNEEKEVASLKKYAGDKPVFFSGFEYKSVVPFAVGNAVGKKVILVSGIANTSFLFGYVATYYEVMHHFEFGDHHPYGKDDIEKIESMKKKLGADSILTTEKDMVKLITPSLKNMMTEKDWFYLPVETKFLKGGSEFDKMVLEMVESNIKFLM